jgi:hypothetical protein
MKRFMFILLAFALLVSVGVAEAKKPPKPTPAQQVATKNAAWMCKALRAANPTAFRVAFGQNKNGKNAYGKCVSAHARAKHLNRVITIKNVTINATGTVTNAGAVGCQFTVAGCTLTSSGTLTGVVGGTYTSTFGRYDPDASWARDGYEARDRECLRGRCHRRQRRPHLHRHLHGDCGHRDLQRRKWCGHCDVHAAAGHDERTRWRCHRIRDVHKSHRTDLNGRRGGRFQREPPARHVVSDLLCPRAADDPQERGRARQRALE